ncbi:RING finger domain-containing protein [Cordyceps javanica]|nr:RING finger domain-containing protein [Cordyceps javanica]
MEPQSWSWSSAMRNNSTQGGETRQRNTNDQPPRPDDHRYGPRTCRICLDTVEPKYADASETGRPTYVSEDPTLGRLLSPCKCKGTQKYVHEGCLHAWRASSPSQERNFWHCPTCGYKYQLARLDWASLLSSKITQALLTLLLFAMGIFILGFIADPVFNLWLDPFGTISDALTADEENWDMPFEEPPTWIEHFVKGFFSLGIVGLVKSALFMSPWHWWQLRGTGVGGGGRRRGTGRGRVENLSLLFVLLGAFAALKGIWKLVRSLSARVLLHMRDRVIDVDED